MAAWGSGQALRDRWRSQSLRRRIGGDRWRAVGDPTLSSPSPGRLWACAARKAILQRVKPRFESAPFNVRLTDLDWRSFKILSGFWKADKKGADEPASRDGLDGRSFEGALPYAQELDGRSCTVSGPACLRTRTWG